MASTFTSLLVHFVFSTKNRQNLIRPEIETPLYNYITVNAILKSAKHGKGEIGDRKIFITNLEEGIRIRTEERGNQAI